MRPPSQLRTLSLEITAVADRGMAMGHLDGKVVFVPLAAPGDRVAVEVVREKRHYAQARLLRVLEPSPLRREPLCPHFGFCGGCQWQHLPYPEQLAGKVRSFQGFLRGRLGLRDSALFRPALPSPREWGYRNRASLKVRSVGERVLLGYFVRGSHRLVPVEGCPVLDPALQELLPRLRGFLEGFAPAQGALPQIDLQVDGVGGVWAVFHLLRGLSPGDLETLRTFLAAVGAAGASLQAGRKHTLSRVHGAESRMPFAVRAEGRELPLEVSPGGFVQANPAVNQSLVDAVTALRDAYAGRTALDLYCGAGNFTLPLAASAACVVGVEGYPPAARDARANAAGSGMDHVRVLTLPAEEGLRTLAAEGFRPALALLDPPREGAAEAVTALAHLAPEHVLYVSCAPATLARDLQLLLAAGYRLEWVQPADMFPQTAHLESVTLLTRAHPA